MQCLSSLFKTLWVCLPLATAWADSGPWTLYYTEPAAYQSNETSNEALPVGNGRLAAMVYGGIGEEILQFNEDTVWAGHPHDYAHPGAVDVLETIRQHVWAGQGQAAWDVAKDRFMSVPLRQCPYQPTAELRLSTGHHGVQDYRRELDLNTATASVQYHVGAVTYRREVFASTPDQVLVVRLTASAPGQVSVTCRLQTPHAVTRLGVENDDLFLHAKVTHVGRNGLDSRVEFDTRARVIAEGGTVTASGSSLQVTGADAVTVILTAASNVLRYDRLGGDPEGRCRGTIEAAAGKGYAALRQGQLQDYQALFNRVQLDLGGSSRSHWPTDQRLAAIKAGLKASGFDATRFTAHDRQLVALNFQMARYLMISGSRPGAQPLNLQGKWNNEVEPSWEGKMTLNINEEMNYWAAEVTGLPECHEPLIDMVRDLSETGARVAAVHYGAAGWMVHHNTDLWRGAAPINSPGGLWPTGGAWLSMHLWWHYQYSGDPNVLREVYPLMKGAAEFFEDFLVEDPRPGSAGTLLTNPTHSPEQPNPALGDDGEIVAGTTMDSQLLRYLFNALIEASEVLDTDADRRPVWQDIIDRLPPLQIGRYGQLQEWFEDVDQPNQHRHLSGLVGLMPAGHISPIHTPALAAAAEVVLDWKGDGSNNTAWSRAWKMCLRTHLLQGDHAYMILNDLLGNSHSPNMTFSVKGHENQIDGNLGALMGTAEMLLQSDFGEIFLLPALPTALSTGSVSGLRARGGYEVDIAWRSGALVSATIRSRRAGVCRVRSQWPLLEVRDSQGPVALRSVGQDLYEFDTRPGQEVRLVAPEPPDDGSGVIEPEPLPEQPGAGGPTVPTRPRR